MAGYCFFWRPFPQTCQDFYGLGFTKKQPPKPWNGRHMSLTYPTLTVVWSTPYSELMLQ